MKLNLQTIKTWIHQSTAPETTSAPLPEPVPIPEVYPEFTIPEPEVKVRVGKTRLRPIPSIKFRKYD